MDWLNGDAVTVARRLLGCELIRTFEDGRATRLKIVEVEAYMQSDPASHSHTGSTPRTEVMFGPAGHLYVYFTYGMHYCMNIVCGPAGEGAAVLIRAVEPLENEDELQANRPGKKGRELTNGPAKLCQALGIDRSWNGHDLTQLPLQLHQRTELNEDKIVRTTRIGITKAVDQPWRFYIRDNPYVSKQ